MVIKYALVEINERCPDLFSFYIKIDDLKSELSFKEKIDTCVYLLLRREPYISKTLCKLWNEEVKYINTIEEYRLLILSNKKILIRAEDFKE